MKYIILLLLSTTCIHSSLSMHASQAITLPQLPNDVLKKIFIEHFPRTFTPASNPQKVGADITAACVNKELSAFITDPKTLCTIINNISQHHNQDVIAQEIGTQTSLRYLKANRALHNFIYKMGCTKIATMFSKWADATFLPKNQRPFLFGVKSSIPKVKILLNHGASPDTTFNGKTILQVAIEKHNNRLAKTILNYNPRNKCLVEAIQEDNIVILKRILKRKDLSAKELSEGLHCAIQHEDLFSTTLLLDTGANPSQHLYDAVSRALAAVFGFQMRDPEPLMDIVYVLCTYGAWDENAWKLAQATAQTTPQKLLDALETGRLVAHQKMARK